MRIGIDLGGTKIEGIAIADDGAERLRRRIPAPRGNYSRTLAAVAGLVHEIERELGAQGTVGVGIRSAPASDAFPSDDSVRLTCGLSRAPRRHNRTRQRRRLRADVSQPSS